MPRERPLTTEKVLQLVSKDLRIKGERLYRQGHLKTYAHFTIAARDIDKLSLQAHDRRPHESVESQIAKLRQEQG